MTRPAHSPPPNVVLLLGVGSLDCDAGIDVEEVELIFEIIFNVLDEIVDELV